MGVFHVFKIVQMVPNHATRHMEIHGQHPIYSHIQFVNRKMQTRKISASYNLRSNIAQNLCCDVNYFQKTAVIFFSTAHKFNKTQQVCKFE